MFRDINDNPRKPVETNFKRRERFNARLKFGRIDSFRRLSKGSYSMRENVRLVIEKFEMLLRGDSVVVGLSGGADSVALACVLRELGAKVFAAHVNHNLRGVDSDADEAFVKGLCRKLGVDLKVFSVDVKKYAEEKKIGIEEAARIIRYEFLELARAEFGAEKIAVGHNSDDNAETVLMNLCRGSGLRGLGGIAPVNGAVIRPLIETSRNEIEEYLRNKKIEFIMDESNKSNDFTRNRVR
ncbi:MAG: tRNA lysidine(34) synthetase TilS, partial [Clostridiales bacterium]|nr:tRNA lysidine(34) synthetase TilS [Clostridiales bacterium]